MDKRAKALYLWEKGLSHAQIRQRLTLSRWVLDKWLKEAGVWEKRPDPVYEGGVGAAKLIHKPGGAA